MTGTIQWQLPTEFQKMSHRYLNEVEMELTILWAEMFHHQQEPQTQPV